jgi:DNA-binding XRE family transcriptional regulator
VQNFGDFFIWKFLIETGKYDPSLGLAIKIAQLFECPLETIFFFDPIIPTTFFSNPISQGASSGGYAYSSKLITRVGSCGFSIVATCI